MPRHSPCALISLTFVEQPISKLFSLWYLWIMQASVWFHCSFCYPLINIKSPQKFVLCYLSVACSQFLACFTVQFSRCRFCSLSRPDRNILRRILLSALEWSFLCLLSFSKESKWWAQVDSNHRPHDYQSCALASWAMGPSWKAYTL